MERNLCSFDLSALKELYNKEAEILQVALLDGASWEDMKDQRLIVTELAIALHKKIQGSTGNPAENSLRGDPEPA
jgi:hypothetical protein